MKTIRSLFVHKLFLREKGAWRGDSQELDSSGTWLGEPLRRRAGGDGRPRGKLFPYGSGRREAQSEVRACRNRSISSTAWKQFR